MDSKDEEDWEYLVDEANYDEVYHALSLFRSGAIPPQIFNSYWWVSDCAERLEAPEDTMPRLAYLDLVPNVYQMHPPTDHPIPFSDGRGAVDSLSGLSEEYSKLKGSEKKALKNYNPDHPFIKNPLEYFIQTLRFGSYPEPEIMLSIMKSIELYFEARGDLTLEDVFFGSPQQRVGNYAARRCKEFKGLSLVDFHDTVFHESEYYKCYPHMQRSTLEELAEQFIQHEIINKELDEIDPTDIDVDSFLRTYRRWLKKR